MKFIYIAFKNVLPTSQKAHHVTVTKTLRKYAKFTNVSRGPNAKFLTPEICVS